MKKEFELMAARSEPMPEGLTASERQEYSELTELYSFYKTGSIDKETAAWVKKLIEDRARQYELCMAHGDMWKRIEQAGTRYAKSRDIESADQFYKAVYGLGVRHDMKYYGAGGERNEYDSQD